VSGDRGRITVLGDSYARSFENANLRVWNILRALGERLEVNGWSDVSRTRLMSLTYDSGTNYYRSGSWRLTCRYIRG